MITNSPPIIVDGNEAVASVAHRTNEVIAVYPITPASPMGELADDWSVHGQRNIWGNVPEIIEMQSEGGAAGTVHGSLQAGAIATTFTASQGLLLMLPNLYKIAGELTPFCLHVAMRSVATHALSIFCDHSDVMACRQAGFAMLASASVQEAHDFSCIAQSATLKSRVPFIHMFDGFRTSHEISKIKELSDAELRRMIDEEDVEAHRSRALSPDHPVLRGTSQNPDVFFQAREAINPFYEACPKIVQSAMDRFGEMTGRQYHLFDYIGHPEAERIIVIMASGGETVQETMEQLIRRGERVGLVKVRLYRPFDGRAFIDALPRSARSIAVLDRTKEPGALGEPLYLDVVGALHADRQSGRRRLEGEPHVIGGRYGLSGKEFTPAMVKSVVDELDRDKPKSSFTVGIIDDVTGHSLPEDTEFEFEEEEIFRAIFYALGSDGTVSANKNSIKIIGQETDNSVQGYFVYDSRKSGAVTVSHLRFGPRSIKAPFLIEKANFVGCHQYAFLDGHDVLEAAAPGATFLLNAPYPPEQVWDHMPKEVQETIIEKNLRFYAIDAYRVAREAGLGRRINTVMQACFFSIAQIIDQDQAVVRIKEKIEETYGARGPELVRCNFKAVEEALHHLQEIPVPSEVTSKRKRPPIVSEQAPDFVQRITALMLAGKGDLLPVSAFPVDGTWPVGTSQWEKRNIALEIPIWDPGVCIQCNHCTLVCPHAAIRAKVYPPDQFDGAPEKFLAQDFRGKEFEGFKYTIQVAPEDCTGCSLCVRVCPAKDKSNPRHKAINMVAQLPVRDQERENYAFFLDLPEVDRTRIERIDPKTSQFLQPLFEYSGACHGCGETPYLKLLTQLFGDRLLIANATGCSSIYGGNLPTTPYTVNPEGRGPAWSNSLFEDNAEFGLGFRLAVDAQKAHAEALLKNMSSRIGEELVTEILEAPQKSEAEIMAQRDRIQILRGKLGPLPGQEARHLSELADYLVRKSVWLVGGDGWAYDIGYGGLDHVLSLGRDVNVLVLDTEVYSNTGGQQSKATPLAAAAKFAIAGKEIPKKELGLEAMSHGSVYVARVAFGAKMSQTVSAFQEADAYEGPSIIIAYSHCIAHGYDLAWGVEQQKLAVASGMWPLYRFDPERQAKGEPPLKLDFSKPKIPVADYMRNEARFRMVEAIDPVRFRRLQRAAQTVEQQRFAVYEQLAGLTVPIIEKKS